MLKKMLENRGYTGEARQWTCVGRRLRTLLRKLGLKSFIARLRYRRSLIVLDGETGMLDCCRISGDLRCSAADLYRKLARRRECSWRLDVLDCGIETSQDTYGGVARMNL